MKSSRDLWGVRKGFHAAYDLAQAQSLLAQERPGLLGRYKDLVHADTGDQTVTTRQDEALEQLVAKSERALEQLEALVKAYVTTGQAATVVDGMERAIQERPDLYAAHAQGVRRDSRRGGETVSVQKVVR